MWLRSAVIGLIAGSLAMLAGQAAAPAGAVAEPKPAEATAAGGYVVDTGTHIPLSMINSVSTKHSSEGERVYLESVFPILVNGRLVIPPGSYVAGTVTQIKRPGRVKGRGELYLRFDSLTLPNGVTRDFRARIGGLDGLASEELDKDEGKIRSAGDKSGDARTVERRRRPERRWAPSPEGWRGTREWVWEWARARGPRRGSWPCYSRAGRMRCWPRGPR